MSLSCYPCSERLSELQATAALKACQGSLERAADWLFSHSADLETSVNEVLQPNLNAATASKEGRHSLLSPKATSLQGF